MRINVKGGTNAGWRRTKPKPIQWFCQLCETLISAHWTRCPDCGNPRPN